MRRAIWYNLYNLKNVKNAHGEVLLLVKLQAHKSFRLKFSAVVDELFECV